jgi:hypothetical protein
MGPGCICAIRANPPRRCASPQAATSLTGGVSAAHQLGKLDRQKALNQIQA